MPARTGAIVRLGVATLLAAAAASAGAQTAGELRETFGDWEIRCAPNTDDCVMSQVAQDDQGNDVLQVRISKLSGVTGPNGEALPAVIQVLTPLGVNLKAGIRVKIDGNEVRGAAYEVCLQGGCVVREPMSTDFLDEMKGGRSANFAIVASPQREVSVDVSLSGFTRAFNNIDA